MKEIIHLVVGRLDTPLGEMLIATDADRSLRAVKWTNHEERMLYLLRRYYGTDGFRIESGAIPSEISEAMRCYFAGNLGALNSLPVKMAGTEFQRAVWQALRNIPSGRTVSYAELAMQIGKPKAIRAVGHANGSNPVSLVVPCHRVIGSDGTLTGYGGGIDRKRWLLQHESALYQQHPEQAALALTMINMY